MIPLFKSHYSIGKSILTLEEEGSSIEDGPQSIIDLCKKNKIKDLFLVDDSMSGFLQGYLNSEKAKLNFRFGLRISVCEDLREKNEEQRKNYIWRIYEKETNRKMSLNEPKLKIERQIENSDANTYYVIVL